MFNFKKNPKPSCFTSSSKFSSLTSENEFENKENSTFHVNRNNIYSLHENYTSKLSQTEDPNYQSNIHKENTIDSMLLKSILPDYKSKNFGIVNKLNKNSFTNDNTDFIEFQCEKNKKYSIDPLENPKENFIDLKMKSKFFEKINTIFKNRYCQYFESFTRNLYQISKKMDHLNTSTMDTNFSSLENRKSIEKNYKKYCACVFLIHLIDHKSKESKIYYFQKIKHSNELKLLKKQFAAKIEEKDRMHEQVCENYEEMLGVERENSERLYKINIAQNNSLDSKKITMKKKPLEIRKNPKKNEILTLFNNYQDKILANYEIELKNKEEIQKIIIINEKNKLLLYDLVIDLINKFEN